jgi:hypothetical protein
MLGRSPVGRKADERGHRQIYQFPLAWLLQAGQRPHVLTKVAAATWHDEEDGGDDGKGRDNESFASTVQKIQKAVSKLVP